MTQPWHAEQVVSRTLAAALLEEQFPELAPVTAKPFGAGFDNTAFLVNAQYLFRFPRRQFAVPLLDTETRLLPWLAPQLPFAVPVPRFVGRPGQGFPWPYVGYPLLPGRTACAVHLDAKQRTALAGPLGRFLQALHALPAAEATIHGAGPDTIARLDLARRLPAARAELDQFARQGIIAQAQPLWNILDGAPAAYTPRADVLVHGDCYARHLLIGPDNALVGVIDWGDVHLGDPAADLMVAHAFLPPEARTAFREAYGSLDGLTWQMARLRALWHTLKVLAYAQAINDADLLGEGRLALKYLSIE
jgi:aminoglycoside phosphotransferase (APT) family kinase protein